MGAALSLALDRETLGRKQFMLSFGLHLSTLWRDFALSIYSGFSDHNQLLTILRESTLCVQILSSELVLGEGSRLIVSEHFGQSSTRGVFLLIFAVLVLNNENVNCVSIRRACQKLRSVHIVKHKRVDVSVSRATTHFLEGNGWLGIVAHLFGLEEPNDCACFTSCCQEISSLAQHDSLNRGVVGFEDAVGALGCVVSDTHETLLTVGCGQNSCIFSIWVERAQTLRIIASIDSIDES